MMVDCQCPHLSMTGQGGRAAAEAAEETFFKTWRHVTHALVSRHRHAIPAAQSPEHPKRSHQQHHLHNRRLVVRPEPPRHNAHALLEPRL